VPFPITAFSRGIHAAAALTINSLFRASPPYAVALYLCYDSAMTYDVIVVGGGIIGCSIALKLASYRLKVLVVERGSIGCEASRAAAGMLSPQAEAHSAGPFFDLCMRSRELHPSFAASLTERSGVDVEYRAEGTLCVVAADEDEHEQSEWSGWQVRNRLPIQSVERDELLRIEPAMTAGARSAIFLQGDHQVENRRVMDALAVAVKNAGVAVLEGVEVESLITNGNRVGGVRTPDGQYAAGTVVVAAGCWSSRLLQPAGVDIKVVPAHGQMLALKPSEPLLSHVVYSRGCYLVPRRDNRVIVGSTVEYIGYRKHNTAAAMSSLLAAACRMVPSLGDAAIVEFWSGLRPDTADHLPILGQCALDNLILATGHFRSGILLAPVTAELISETIVSGVAPAMLQPFGAGRFMRARS
jgi:glycine oxidase